MALVTLPGAWATSGGAVIIGGGGSGGGPGSDTTAIHVDVAGEIAGIAAKASPVGTDIVVIEDSAAANAKKSALLSNLPFLASNTGLDAVLANDNQTGGTDISVTGGDAVIHDENAAVPWTPAAGRAVFWVKNDAPNTPYFTDDGGTDHLLAYVGGAGIDSTAIHDDVAGEINAITSKATPTTSDLLLIEDAAASNAKKKITIGSLPSTSLSEYSRVTGYTGKGSTNGNICRFTTQTESGGTDITFTDSATDGSYWAISTTGFYAVSATIVAGNDIGPYYVNVASALSNTLDASHIRAASNIVNSTGNQYVNVCWTGRVAAGDEIWISTGSTPVNETNLPSVSVTRVQ